MLNFRPVLYVNGILLGILSVAMLIPAFFDLAFHQHEASSFFISAFLCAFIGISLVLTNHGQITTINIRQAFVLTTSSWVTVAIFGALPFWFTQQGLSYTDSFFESMSGITTTGSTILTKLDDLPPGILLWRSLLHWIGGMGIIIISLVILPLLNIGGMQLFYAESSEQSDKALPRTVQISLAIGSVYLMLTVLCAIALWAAGMNEFDAVNHAMSTISTGGFSTHDKSILYYHNVAIEHVLTVFMILSAAPFVLYVQMLRGNAKAFWQDSQVQLFIGLLIASIFVIMVWLAVSDGISFLRALRYAIFNTTSVMTGTGFWSNDYSLWGAFATTLLFMLSVVGGCTGSTTGGIKIFRYLVLYQSAKAQIIQMVEPNSVLRPRFNNKPLTDAASSSVMSFMVLFACAFLVLTLFLSLCGLDFVSSISASAAALSNLGHGLGPTLGPSGNYSSIPDIAKWGLSVAMLLGRLELFTVLVLFSPYFWRE